MFNNEFIKECLGSNLSIVGGQVYTGKSTALSECGLKAMTKEKNVMFFFQENIPNHFRENFGPVSRMFPRSFCSVQEGMMRTFEDFERIVLSQMEIVNPGFIVLDCAQFCKTESGTVEEFRQLASTIHTPILISLQFNRRAAAEGLPFIEKNYKNIPFCDNLMILSNNASPKWEKRRHL